MIAADHYEKHLGRRPRGIWLAECGYRPGRRRAAQGRGDQVLLHRHARDTLRRAAAEIRRLRPGLLPRHRGGRLRARPRVVEAGLEREGRVPRRLTTIATSTATSGSISITTTSGPSSTPTGTGSTRGSSTTGSPAPSDEKEAYRPSIAREKAAEHAGNFMFNREKQVEHLCRAPRHEADHRLAVRRRALRPLVVRGPGVDRVPPAQDPLRPGDDRDDHPVRVSRAPPEAAGRAAVDVVLGVQGLQRGLARRARTTGSTRTCT